MDLFFQAVVSKTSDTNWECRKKKRNAAQPLCIKCPAGKIANANDQASCQTLCAVGDYLSGSSCVAMTVQTCTHGESFSSASRYVKSDVTMLVVLLVVV